MSKTFATNKKAYFDYEILEKFEAGIALTGPEVKSIRAGQCNLKGSYIEFNSKEEPFAKGIHISPYKPAADQTQEPTRVRKLLLNQKEINKIQNELNTAGTTLIPLDFHSSGPFIKLQIGVARGKKKYDKRESLKKKSQDRELRKY